MDFKNYAFSPSLGFKIYSDQHLHNNKKQELNLLHFWRVSRLFTNDNDKFNFKKRGNYARKEYQN